MGGDRRPVRPGDRVVLIVEHDPRFATILLDMAHEKGFKGLITSTGRNRPGAGAVDISRTPSRSTSGCRTWTAGWYSTA